MCGVWILFKSVTDAEFEPSEVTFLRLMPRTGHMLLYHSTKSMILHVMTFMTWPRIYAWRPQWHLWNVMKMPGCTMMTWSFISYAPVLWEVSKISWFHALFKGCYGATATYERPSTIGFCQCAKTIKTSLSIKLKPQVLKPQVLGNKIINFKQPKCRFPDQHQFSVCALQTARNQILATAGTCNHLDR